jgi:hypothetical protein
MNMAVFYWVWVFSMYNMYFFTKKKVNKYVSVILIHNTSLKVLTLDFSVSECVARFFFLFCWYQMCTSEEYLRCPTP